MNDRGPWLIQAYFEQDLSPDDERELAAWLKSDRNNVRYLLWSAQIDSHLGEVLCGQSFGFPLEHLVDGAVATSEKEAVSGLRSADSQSRLEAVDCRLEEEADGQSSRHTPGAATQSSRHTPCAVTEAEELSVVSGPLSVAKDSPSTSSQLTTDNGPRTPSPIPHSALRIRQSLSRRPYAFSYFVATVATVIILMTAALTPIDGDSEETGRIAYTDAPIQFVAQVTGDKDCVWGDRAEAVFANAHLRPGQVVHLESGLAEVTFKSGAVAVVEGPAVFAMEGTNRGRLERGKLVARVEKKTAKRFTIETPAATIVDMGTKFFVDVQPSGELDVGVLEGSVEVHYMADVRANGNSTSRMITARPSQRLGIGESIRVDSQGGVRSIPISENERLAHVPEISLPVAIELLRNPSFEAVGVADGAVDATVHGWREGDLTGFAVETNAHIFNPPRGQFAYAPAISFPFPAPTHGDQYAVLVLRNDETSSQSFIYQSIGVIKTSDVGMTIRLSADLGAHYQGKNKQANGHVSLRRDVTQKAIGVNVVHEVGQDWETGRRVVHDGDPLIESFVEWTITEMHVGTEVFAVISFAALRENIKSNSDQYLVDNVKLMVKSKFKLDRQTNASSGAQSP